MKKIIVLLLVISGLISTVPAFAATNIHSVNAGESLWSISQQYGVSLEQLARLNPDVESDNLLIGTDLIIGASEYSSYLYHVVQDFDNLNSLAAQYQVPVQVIVNANNIKNNVVVTGQTIKIPVPDPETTVAYTISKGETLGKLADKYQTTVALLEELNYGIDANNLKVGDRIYIPASLVHVVKSNETINKIANAYDVDVKQLLELNNLVKDQMLLIGQKLFIQL